MPKSYSATPHSLWIQCWTSITRAHNLHAALLPNLSWLFEVKHVHLWFHLPLEIQALVNANQFKSSQYQNKHIIVYWIEKACAGPAPITCVGAFDRWSRSAGFQKAVGGRVPILARIDVYLDCQKQWSPFCFICVRFFFNMAIMVQKIINWTV